MVEEFYIIFMSFNWFVSMATINLLHPVMPAAFLLPFLLLLCPFIFINHRIFKERAIRNLHLKLRLASLTFIWIFIGFLGAVFRHKGPLSGYNDQLFYVLYGLLLIYVGLGIFYIFKNKGYRSFTCVFFFINLYFVLFVGLCSSMSIGGVWL